MHRNVLVVSHAREIGGAEGYLAEILLTAARTERVDLACRPDAALDPWCAELEGAGVAVHRVDVRRPQDVWRLGRLARRAHVVHVNLSHPIGKYQLAAVAAARLAGRPLLITHLLTVDVDDIGIGRPSRAVWASSMRAMCALATRHVALTASAREILVGRYGCRPENIVVSPTFVDTSRFRPLKGEQRAQVREEVAETTGQARWGSATEVILTVARLSPQKGLFDLLDVAAVTAAGTPDWRFVIVGDGELRRTLEEEIVARGLSERVLLAGPQPRERIYRWLGAADVFFLPSHFEGVPIAILEAIAAGCPVVATEVGGVPDIGLRPPFGCTAPAGATGRLAQGLAEAIAWPRPDDPSGRALLLAPYDRDRCVGAVLEQHRQLASPLQATA